MNTALDPELPRPLYLQIYDSLRQGILTGDLAPGSRLGASRNLAVDLGVSRNTVVLAFEHLAAEGYLETRTGAGTFVTASLPDPAPTAPPPPRRKLERRQTVSARGRRLSDFAHRVAVRPPTPFQAGLPALDHFPYALWNRLLNRTIRNLPTDAWGYAPAGGHPPLRRAISSYLRTRRGVECDPEQVVIVSGSQQGIDLAARVLLDAGDSAVIEDPGYGGARAALWGASVETLPVPVDAEGLQVRSIPDLDSAPRLVCVTPSHQHPLGSTLSVSRRLELLAWASRLDAWILEDDYDSEFRYSGRPVATLKSLDDSERVLYLGTFSKVMFPGLRLGYLVVPRQLISAFEAARFCADRHSPILDQATTTAFMEQGHFARHVRRMRVLYQSRQEILLDLADTVLGHRVEVRPSPAGMHLVAWLDPEADDRAVARAALDAGLQTAAVSAYAIQAPVAPGLLLGYSGFDASQMKEAMTNLAGVIDAEV